MTGSMPHAAPAPNRSNVMSPLGVYALLQEACRELDRNGDHAIAAHVGHAMALIERKYGVGEDHLDLDKPQQK